MALLVIKSYYNKIYINWTLYTCQQCQHMECIKITRWDSQRIQSPLYCKTQIHTHTHTHIHTQGSIWKNKIEKKSKGNFKKMITKGLPINLLCIKFNTIVY